MEAVPISRSRKAGRDAINNIHGGIPLSVSGFLRPLEEWKHKNELQEKEFNERFEELNEQIEIAKQQLLSNKKRNLATCQNIIG